MNQTMKIKAAKRATLIAHPLGFGFTSAAADKWTDTLTYPDEAFSNSERNAHFILEPGYQLKLTGKENGKQTELIITVLNETLDVGGVKMHIIEERESANGKLVEVSRNCFAIGTTTKNVYYFGEDVDMFKSGGKVIHDGLWRAGSDGAKHGIMIPGPGKVGDRHHQKRALKIALFVVKVFP